MIIEQAFLLQLKLRRERWMDGVLLLVVVFNGALLLWLLAKPGGHDLAVAIDNVAQFGGPLLVLPFCFSGAGDLWRRRAAGTPAEPHRWAPILLGMGILAFAAGQIVYTAYEQVFHFAATPLPSWADPFFLLAYPCLLIGILLLPQKSLPLVVRSRLFLDGLVTMTALTTFSWYFILGPTILQGSGSVLGQIVGAAYPICDLILISCLLFLSPHAAGPGLRPVVRTLWLGLGIIVVTDCCYDYLNVHSVYSTGSVLPDLGWPLGYMLVGLAAYKARLTGDARWETPPRQAAVDHNADSAPLPIWRAMLPYTLIPCVGVLVIFARRATNDPELVTGVYAGSTVLVVLLLARQVVALLENKRLYRSLHEAYQQVESNNHTLAEINSRLQSLAITDPLTDLPNHRAMVAALDQELDRARRYNRSCALLFLDLDHFKAINDNYGHPVGDTVLCEVAAVARRSLRTIDTLGRWGGEELVAILPETDREAAITAAEHVRRAVAIHSFSAGGGTHLTCSIGVAIHPADGVDRSSLLAAADQAMYAAKRFGRNQVRCTDDPATETLASGTGQSGSREDVALAGTVEALAALVGAHGNTTDTRDGTLDVSALSIQLALACGLSAAESRMVGLAGRLYDIGTIGVPAAVLSKPDRLTEEEWARVRVHPIMGEDVVSRIPALRGFAPIIRAHQERWDGSGYPDGLSGTGIPLGARIIAVTAAYRALVTGRPYRQARDPAWALKEIHRCAGTQFDPAVVAALRQVLQATSSVYQPVH